MTVLQLISSGGYYGAESMIINLSRAAGGMGCRSIVAGFRNTQNPHVEILDRAREYGLDAEIIDCSGRMDRGAVRALRRIVAERGVNIVHCHGSKPNAYAWAAVRRLGIPLIATYHLDWPDRGVLLHAYHLLDRVLLRSFDKVVGVSRQIVDSLRRAGIPDAKLATIENGIDVTPFSRTESAFAREIGKGTRPVVGVVGRLTPQKGQEYLLRAVPGILERVPEALFVFAGGGDDRARLEALAKELRIHPSVIFAGPRNDMPDVYAAMDVVALPSVNEGMPMAIIEALASGKPMVATRVGAVPELIRHEETGLLVEPRDVAALGTAVCRLLTDAALAARLGGTGRDRARARFSAESMAAKYIAIYRSALNGGAAKREGSVNPCRG